MPPDEAAEEGRGILPKFDLEHQNLVFRAGGERFAFEIRHILEVIIEEKMVEVPQTPGFVAGAINHMGRVVTVVDPARFFGFGEVAAGERYVVLLDHDQALVGLLADRIEGIEFMPPDLPLGRAEGGDAPRVASFIEGVVSHKGRLVHRLKVNELAERIEDYFD